MGSLKGESLIKYDKVTGKAAPSRLNPCLESQSRAITKGDGLTAGRTRNMRYLIAKPWPQGTAARILGSL
jgi:hypothetical protein